MKKIQLFGGSITLDVPKIFEDCSLLREVPDHQEMWADYDNGESILIELCEMVQEKDEISVKFHFEELARVTKSTKSEIFKTIIFQDSDFDSKLKSCYKTCLFGKMDDYFTIMALIRLPDFKTDILINLTSPKKTDINEEDIKIIKSLKIEDFSLFK